MSVSRKYDLIAQGCTTYSKRKDQYIEGVYPVYYDDMKGVDFVCGLGSNLNGWRNNYALPSKLEPELARRLNKLFPFMEQMRFLKSGSDACEAAVRIARARRPGVVLGLGYHGWHNIFISAEKPGAGTACEGYVKKDTIPELIARIKEGVDEKDVAYNTRVTAVILEPVILDMNVRGELAELRAVCSQYDVCLIFDEIVTGFRVPKYCIANCFDIIPDIICLGKALGNGYPLSVVGGKVKYMDNQAYFISSTHAGEESGLKAALETLDYLTPARLAELWKRGIWFQSELNKILYPIHLRLKGIPTRATWELLDVLDEYTDKGQPEAVKAMFWQEMLKEGFFFGKAFFMNFQHTPAILKRTLAAAKRVTERIVAGKVELEGQLPREVFKRFS